MIWTILFGALGTILLLQQYGTNSWLYQSEAKAREEERRRAGGNNNCDGYGGLVGLNEKIDTKDNYGKNSVKGKKIQRIKSQISKLEKKLKEIE
ncbi:hypothetical protein ACFLZZ_02270 [Nanoarchaeota archaeon]